MATDKMHLLPSLSVSKITESYPARTALNFAICGAFWLTYLAIYLPFLPTASMTVGHDYSIHFPNLLTGYYWYIQNGAWEVPWFSPSQCGGFPFISDPNVIYYSATQLFVILGLAPLRAIQLTFALFALLGMVGTYLLMRLSFKSSQITATVAAVLFLFNGFFTYRVLIGHLTFHAFALLPLMITAILLPPTTKRRSLFEFCLRIGIAALCLTYMFQTGMVHGIPPVMIAVAVIILIHALCFGWQFTPWILISCASLLALAICAGRLVSEFALLSNFPRDGYALPGFISITSGLKSIFQVLFLDISAGHPEVVNSQWILDRHEWEYGVSIAPLILISIWAISILFKKKEHVRGKTTVFSFNGLSPSKFCIYIAIIVLLALPLVLNTYGVTWNALLKEIPYLKNSSSLVRFFCAYILVVIVVAALSLDRISLVYPGFKLTLAVLTLSIVLWQNITTNRVYYNTQPYNVTPIEAEYARASAENTIRPIQEIGNPLNRTEGPNDGLIKGQSQLYCYQSLMGYRLEHFPVRPLRPGPISLAIGSVINLKNPACYLFPKENSCNSGDHFARKALDDALLFAAYRPFPFSKSGIQEAASIISIGSMIITFFFFCMMAVRGIFKWVTR